MTFSSHRHELSPPMKNIQLFISLLDDCADPVPALVFVALVLGAGGCNMVVVGEGL